MKYNIVATAKLNKMPIEFGEYFLPFFLCYCCCCCFGYFGLLWFCRKWQRHVDVGLLQPEIVSERWKRIFIFLPIWTAKLKIWSRDLLNPLALALRERTNGILSNFTWVNYVYYYRSGAVGLQKYTYIDINCEYYTHYLTFTLSDFVETCKTNYKKQKQK